jgi:hypothetical protein
MASAADPRDAVGALVKQERIVGPRDLELQRRLRAYGHAIKKGEPGEDEKKAVVDYVRGLEGGASCDPKLVRSFTEAIAIVDPELSVDRVEGGSMHGGGVIDIATAVFNYMKGICARTTASADEATEFVAGKINAANFSAAAAPPPDTPTAFKGVVEGLLVAGAASAVLTDYPARVTHFIADVLRGINNAALPGYDTMISNAVKAAVGAADLTLVTGEIVSKISVGVILGILVYSSRGILYKHAKTMAEAVVDPATYRGIFTEIFATLRSFGIQTNERIRGVLVTAYQSFVTKADAAGLDKADLEAAAEEADVAAKTKVPSVLGAALVGPVPGAQRIGPGLPLDAAAKLAASVEALRKRGREGDDEAAPPAAKAARLDERDILTESEGASAASGEGDDASVASGDDSSQHDDASGAFADVSRNTSELGSQPPPGSQTSTGPESQGEAMEGGRRCRSCGNVFGKTRRAARGKKSKKGGKTAKKGGKKAVRKGSFRKGRKLSKKQRH